MSLAERAEVQADRVPAGTAPRAAATGFGRQVILVDDGAAANSVVEPEPRKEGRQASRV